MLFVDDYHVHAATGVRRLFHRWKPHPANPIHVFAEPWGSHTSSSGAGYELDPRSGEVVLWYTTGPAQPAGVADRRFICRATSRDGLRWETPPLGLYSFREHRDTNICVTGYTYGGASSVPHEFDTVCIRRDPLDADPSARFKMTVYRYNRHQDATGRPLKFVRDTEFPSGLYTSVSPDGIHWPSRERLVHLLADGFGDTNTFMVDTLRRGYRLFGKRLHHDQVRDTAVRLRHTCWSTDFASWSPYVPILPIDESDRKYDQIYMNHGFVHDDMYLGFVRRLHAHDDWSMDVDFAYSHDGERWVRPPEARAIVPRGEGDAWDSGQIGVYPSAPVRRDNRLFLYYFATADYHSPAPPRALPPASRRPPGLCLATLRPDGFAGLRADGDGRIRTSRLFLRHPELWINVDAAGGGCRVGVLDEGGLAVPGYGPEEMAPISGDAVETRLTWGDRRDVSALLGRWIALDIRLRHGEVFSVRNRGAGEAALS